MNEFITLLLYYICHVLKKYANNLESVRKDSLIDALRIREKILKTFQSSSFQVDLLVLLVKLFDGYLEN